jgi:hypothetical protein
MEWQRDRQTDARVSVLLHPLAVGSAPILWQDWSRRLYRRACIQVVRSQRLEVEIHPSLAPPPDPSPSVLSRAQRAHYRLTFQERLARNARTSTASQVTITQIARSRCLCGFPRSTDRVTFVHLVFTRGSFFSDKLTALSGVRLALFLDFPLFPPIFGFFRFHSSLSSSCFLGLYLICQL